MNSSTAQDRQAAIAQREQREYQAKYRAEKRFVAQQEIIHARKRRNRTLVAFIALITMTSWLFTCSPTAPAPAAKAGEITLKSEMTKPLHTLKPSTEKHS